MAQKTGDALMQQKYLSQRQRMASMSVEERRELSRKGGKATQGKKRAGASLYATTSTEGCYHIHIMPTVFHWHG